jgi:hypothetical protein
MTTCTTGALTCLVAALGATAYAGGGPCTTTELSKLTAPDAAGGDEFGISVSASGDKLVVGSWRNAVGGNLQQGSTYVYRFDGTAWNYQTNLLQPDGAAYDRFGRSVAIDGDIAVAGSHFDDDDGSKSGSASVFRFDGSEWNHVTKLNANDGSTGDEFGWSVAVSGDTIVVGAHMDNGVGSAYVFERDHGGIENWGQVAKLTASDAASEDHFGHAVGISGERIVIGASLHSGNTGAAYVFDRPGGGWATGTENTKLMATDGALGDEYGTSVAVSGDHLIVGAYRDDDAGSASGAAYVYRLEADTWTETKLMPFDLAHGDYFGYSVAVHGDLAIIGAYLDDDNGTSSGSAYVFTFDGTSWSQRAKLAGFDGAGGDALGVSVGVTDGTAVVGAYHDADAGTNTGSAYVYGGLVDCNDNGTLDVCDITEGTSDDLNGNGVPDECETAPCPEDLDGSGDVGFGDILTVIGAWGPCAACPEDLDGSGDVGFGDILALISAWGGVPLTSAIRGDLTGPGSTTSPAPLSSISRIRIPE